MKNYSANVSISICLDDDCTTDEKEIKEVLEMALKNDPEITVETVFNFQEWDD